MKKVVLLLAVLVVLGAVPAGAAGLRRDPAVKLPYGSGDGRAAVASVEGAFRISGANRYATAAEWSRAHWSPEDAFVVYVVSGDATADALSATSGVAYGHLGPVLQTQRDTVPAETVAELQRLQPCAVVVVGGTGVVSTRVEEQLGGYARPELCG